MAKSKKQTILIIDDNPFMVETMAGKFKSAGFDVAMASASKEGLTKTGKEKPAMVLVSLPLRDDINGVNTIQNIKKESRDSKIVVLSDNDTEEYQKKITGLGISAYIVKSYAGTDETAAKFIGILNGKVKEPLVIVGGPRPKEKEEEMPEADSVPSEDKDKKGEGEMEYQSPFAEIGTDTAVPPKIKARIEKALVSPRADLSIIGLVNDLIEYAYHARASDIHLEPFSDRLVARMRIDGILYDVFALPKNSQSEIIARIKVLAGMRTDEHQAAQDGRFKTTIKEPRRQFDIRVSIVPTYYGENAVLRLLAEQSTVKNIEDLAFSKGDREKIKRAVKKPYGMILATGPTGSGKSTTLYTIIKELNVRGTSIITIEDPIEYSVEGIDQIQVNARTGLTFATGLRSILRQDPNIIMVGEIRDKETASIAINAALTGHKLLSTLHTNDAATALPRLLDMDVEPFLIASTVNIVIGQRLVRMLCQHCKTKKKLTDDEFKELAKSIPENILGSHREFYIVKGCDKCGNTGYFDRMGIYEILEINDEVRSAILRRADSSEIRTLAIKGGMNTLLEDGFKKALSGLTTIEEILRVVKE